MRFLRVSCRPRRSGGLLLHRRCGVRLHEQRDEESIHRRVIHGDLRAPFGVRRQGCGQLHAIERALAGQRLARVARPAYVVTSSPIPPKDERTTRSTRRIRLTAPPAPCRTQQW